MGRYITEALTEEQFTSIMKVVKEGFTYTIEDSNKNFRPNTKLFTVLLTQATTGLRIGDIVKIKPRNIIGNNIRLVEEKTGKEQFREISTQTIEMLSNYITINNKSPNDILFSRCTVRSVQKNLKIVCDHLGFINISTHSFRKYFATEIYKNSAYDIELVRRVLNHSSVLTTQKYLGITKKEIDNISKFVSEEIYCQTN